MNLTVISYFLMLCFYAVIIPYFYTRLLTPRKWARHPFLFSCLCMMPNFILCLINYDAVIYINWLMVALPLFFFFSDPLWKRIASYIFTYLIMLFAELASFFIVCAAASLLTGVMSIPSQVQGPQTLIVAAVNIILGAAVTLLAIPFIQSLFHHIRLSTVILIGLPFILCTVAHTLTESWPPFVFSFIFLFPLCYVILSRGFQRMQKEELLRQQREHQRLLIQKQLGYAQELEREYGRLRRWNHDIANHFLALSYLLEQKKYEEGDCYIQSLLDETTDPQPARHERSSHVENSYL